MKKKKLKEDIFVEAEGANTMIVNAAEIVNKEKTKYDDMPETVVNELKYLGEEYGGGNYSKDK